MLTFSKPSKVGVCIAAAYFFRIITCVPTIYLKSHHFNANQYHELDDNFEEWLHLNLSNTSSYYSNSTMGRFPFTLICEDDNPIEFSFEGFISPLEAMIMLPYRRFRRNMGGNAFQALIFFQLWEFSSSILSVKITCHRIDNTNVNSAIQFFNHYELDNGNYLVNAGQSFKLNNAIQFPCSITNPLESDNVQLLSNGINIMQTYNEGITYNPAQGFIFTSPLKGNYTCLLGNHTVDIISEINFGMDEPNNSLDYFYPGERDISLLVNQSQLFVCKSTDEVEETMDNYWMRVVSNASTEKRVEFGASVTEISSLRCLRKFKAHTQRLNVADSPDQHFRIGNAINQLLPELVLDNHSQRFECTSPEKFMFPHKVLVNIKCNTPLECRLKEKCLVEPSLCQERDNIIISYRPIRNPSASIIYFSGLVQCSIGGLNRTWNYFTALNYKRYYDYRTVHLDNLVRLDPTDPVVYTNRTYTITCMAVRFLFAEPLVIAIEFENGTEEYLKLKNDYVFADHPEDKRSGIPFYGSDFSFHNSENGYAFQTKDLHISRTISLKFPIQAVALSCYAPWWNSTRYLKSRESFMAKYLIPAYIVNTTTLYTFYTEGSPGKLICPGKGEPQPLYRWFFNNEEILFEDSVMFTHAIGGDGEGILNFRQVAYNLSGMYLCHVENAHGSASLNFTVDIEEMPLQWGSGLVSGLSLALLLITISAITIFRQYRKIKVLRRNLNAEEMTEFYQGNQILPGDTDLTDLMGTGNFSYVFRGYLKSQRRNVAIKVSKSSTKTDEFKLMLAEIKIVIYIGNHENIVLFIGACTTSIEERKLHIVMELAENGCLNSYLKRKKHIVVEQFDLSEKSNADTITEADLVRWCYEIAKGMEYLASKHIIHADLATRNILLGEHLVAKISDFGLSEQLLENKIYTKKIKQDLPWRWMALESLKNFEFSYQSDVWSFGVTVWEIFSYSDTPFQVAKWSKEFIDLLEGGLRLGKPKNCPNEIYNQMMSCWEKDKSDRPDINVLREFFHVSLQTYESSQGYDQIM